MEDDLFGCRGFSVLIRGMAFGKLPSYSSKCW
jgi:hypothetical protein